MADHQHDSQLAPKKKQKAIMDFSLKEDSENADSSSEDEETNNLLDNLDDSDEEIIVYENDGNG